MSVDTVHAGLMYTNMHGTKIKTNTVMWKVHVERAFCLSAALWVFMKRMDMEETRRSIKFNRQMKALLATTKNTIVWVSVQASFNRGF